MSRSRCASADNSYSIGTTQKETVSYEYDPATGQHVYYARSNVPIEKWDNLTGGERQSFDFPRCGGAPRNSEGAVLNIQSERFSSPRRPYPTSPSRQQACPITPFGGRPDTPPAFGGRGIPRQYQPDEFELPQSEQMLSPGQAIQNFQFETPRTPQQVCPVSPPRGPVKRRPAAGGDMVEQQPGDNILRNEQFRMRRQYQDSEYADLKIRRDVQRPKLFQPRLSDRVQKIKDEMTRRRREGMKTPRPVPAPRQSAAPCQEQGDDEAVEDISFQPIQLDEPCLELIGDHQDQQQDLDFDPGILSAGEMDDEFSFGEMDDPKSFFQEPDENLVTRNVVTVETDTTTHGETREVIEKVLEKEEVSVLDQSRDEDLANISLPMFDSPDGLSPLRVEETRVRPRRLFEDFPDENLEDVDEIDFAPDLDSPNSPSSEQLRREKLLSRVKTPENVVSAGEPASATPRGRIMPRTTVARRRIHEVDEPEESICKYEHPGDSFTTPTGPIAMDESTIPTFLDDSELLSEYERLDIDYTPVEYQFSPPARPLPEVEAEDEICDVSQPFDFEDSFQPSPERRPLPQLDESGRLSDMSGFSELEDPMMEFAEQLESMSEPSGIDDSITCSPAPYGPQRQSPNISRQSAYTPSLRAPTQGTTCQYVPGSGRTPSPRTPCPYAPGSPRTPSPRQATPVQGSPVCPFVPGSRTPERGRSRLPAYIQQMADSPELPTIFQTPIRPERTPIQLRIPHTSRLRKFDLGDPEFMSPESSPQDEGGICLNVPSPRPIPQVEGGTCPMGPSPGRQVEAPCPQVPSPGQQVQAPCPHIPSPGQQLQSPGRMSNISQLSQEPSYEYSPIKMDGSPQQRGLPQIEADDEICDVSQPFDFEDSFQPSPERRPLPQLDESGRLSDMSGFSELEDPMMEFAEQLESMSEPSGIDDSITCSPVPYGPQRQSPNISRQSAYTPSLRAPTQGTTCQYVPGSGRTPSPRTPCPYAPGSPRTPSPRQATPVQGSPVCPFVPGSRTPERGRSRLPAYIQQMADSPELPTIFQTPIRPERTPIQLRIPHTSRLRKRFDMDDPEFMMSPEASPQDEGGICLNVPSPRPIPQVEGGTCPMGPSPGRQVEAPCPHVPSPGQQVQAPCPHLPSPGQQLQSPGRMSNISQLSQEPSYEYSPIKMDGSPQQRGLPQIEADDEICDVSQPFDFEDSFQPSPERRPLPQLDESGRLSDMSGFSELEDPMMEFAEQLESMSEPSGIDDSITCSPVPYGPQRQSPNISRQSAYTPSLRAPTQGTTCQYVPGSGRTPSPRTPCPYAPGSPRTPSPRQATPVQGSPVCPFVPGSRTPERGRSRLPAYIQQMADSPELPTIFQTPIRPERTPIQLRIPHTSRLRKRFDMDDPEFMMSPEASPQDEGGICLNVPSPRPIPQVEGGTCPMVPSPGRQVEAPCPQVPSPGQQVQAPCPHIPSPGQQFQSPGRMSNISQLSQEPSYEYSPIKMDGSPQQRGLPQIEADDEICDVSQPFDFEDSFQPSPERRPLPQLDESGRLSDMSGFSELEDPMMEFAEQLESMSEPSGIDDSITCSPVPRQLFADVDAAENIRPSVIEYSFRQSPNLSRRSAYTPSPRPPTQSQSSPTCTYQPGSPRTPRSTTPIQGTPVCPFVPGSRTPERGRSRLPAYIQQMADSPELPTIFQTPIRPERTPIQLRIPHTSRLRKRFDMDDPEFMMSPEASPQDEGGICLNVPSPRPITQVEGETCPMPEQGPSPGRQVEAPCPYVPSPRQQIQTSSSRAASPVCDVSQEPIVQYSPVKYDMTPPRQVCPLPEVEAEDDICNVSQPFEFEDSFQQSPERRPLPQLDESGRLSDMSGFSELEDPMMEFAEQLESMSEPSGFEDSLTCSPMGRQASPMQEQNEMLFNVSEPRDLDFSMHPSYQRQNMTPCPIHSAERQVTPQLDHIEPPDFQSIDRSPCDRREDDVTPKYGLAEQEIDFPVIRPRKLFQASGIRAPTSMLPRQSQLRPPSPEANIPALQNICQIRPPSRIEGTPMIPEIRINDCPISQPSQLRPPSRIEGQQNQSRIMPPCRMEGPQSQSRIRPPSRMDLPQAESRIRPPCRVDGPQPQSRIRPPSRTDVQQTTSQIRPPSRMDVQQSACRIRPPPRTDVQQAASRMRPPSRTDVQQSANRTRPPPRTDVQQAASRMRPPSRTDVQQSANRTRPPPRTDVQQAASRMRPPSRTDVQQSANRARPPSRTDVQQSACRIRPPPRTDVQQSANRIRPPPRADYKTPMVAAQQCVPQNMPQNRGESSARPRPSASRLKLKAAAARANSATRIGATRSATNAPGPTSARRPQATPAPTSSNICAPPPTSARRPQATPAPTSSNTCVPRAASAWKDPRFASPPARARKTQATPAATCAPPRATSAWKDPRFASPPPSRARNAQAPPVPSCALPRTTTTSAWKDPRFASPPASRARNAQAPPVPSCALPRTTTASAWKDPRFASPPARPKKPQAPPVPSCALPRTTTTSAWKDPRFASPPARARKPQAPPVPSCALPRTTTTSAWKDPRFASPPARPKKQQVPSATSSNACLPRARSAWVDPRFAGPPKKPQLDQLIKKSSVKLTTTKSVFKAR